jgi:redox-sensitive bicupin YhaK (pirin superfamily)
VITLPGQARDSLVKAIRIHVIDVRGLPAMIHSSWTTASIFHVDGAGGPHPHAGFEIVTFVVGGEARDRDEGLLRAGDVLWMTAGSGVVHNEDVEPLGKVRILQLWVTLPSASRWVAPRFEHVPREDAPLRQEPGIEARVYSGASGLVQAPAHTFLPMMMVDVRLSPNAIFEQAVQSSYSGFLYPLQGDLLVDGTAPQRLSPGQWMAGIRRSINNCSSHRGGRTGRV